MNVKFKHKWDNEICHTFLVVLAGGFRKEAEEGQRQCLLLCDGTPQQVAYHTLYWRHGAPWQQGEMSFERGGGGFKDFHLFQQHFNDFGQTDQIRRFNHNLENPPYPPPPQGCLTFSPYSVLNITPTAKNTLR